MVTKSNILVTSHVHCPVLIAVQENTSDLIMIMIIITMITDGFYIEQIFPYNEN